MSGESSVLDALVAELLGDVGKLHDRVKALNAALPDVSEAVREAGRDAADSIGVAVGKAVAELSKSAADAEVAKVQAQVNKIAEEVLMQVRKEASASAPYGWKVRVGLGVCGVILLGGLAGGIIGAAWFGKAEVPTAEQAKQIEAGRDFLQVLPQMDQATREKLIRMIEKNRQGT